MPTEATPSRGTRLYIASAEGVYEDDHLAQVRDIPIPSQIRDKIDVSNQDSAESVREYIAGWADTDDLELESVFTSTNFAYAKDLVGRKRWMWICFPRRNAGDYDEDQRYDGTPPHSKPYVQFIGCILGVGGEAPYEEHLTATMTIAVSGAITFEEQDDDAPGNEFPDEPAA